MNWPDRRKLNNNKRHKLAAAAHACVSRYPAGQISRGPLRWRHWPIAVASLPQVGEKAQITLSSFARDFASSIEPLECVHLSALCHRPALTPTEAVLCLVCIWAEVAGRRPVPFEFLFCSAPQLREAQEKLLKILSFSRCARRSSSAPLELEELLLVS